MLRMRAENVFTWLAGYSKGTLDPVTSYKHPTPWFIKSYRDGLWDGTIRFVKWHHSRRCYYVPTGFLDLICQYLAQQGVEYGLEDCRTFEPVQTPCYEVRHRDLGLLRIDQGKYDYQAQALDAALTFGRGVIQIGTGGGKTLTGAALIRSIGKRTVWFTHRLSLAYQTQRRLSEHLEAPVGFIGDGRADYKDVTVAMVQTCRHRDHDQFLDSCEVLIADEAHRAESTSKEWFDNMAAVGAPYRFGLTATPNLCNEGLALLGLTGSIIFSLSSEELISRGVLVPPRIWIAEVRLPDQEKEKDWRIAYANGVLLNCHRNTLIQKMALRFKQEKKPSLILSCRIKHGEMLTRLCNMVGVRAEFIRGSVKQADRDRILDKLWAGKLDTVVAIVSTMGEGVDIPKLRAIINATGTSGGGDAADGETGRDTIQILGRGLRASPGKEYVDYVDFADLGSKMLASASADRISTLNSEGFGKYVRYWDDYATVG